MAVSGIGCLGWYLQEGEDDEEEDDEKLAEEAADR